jgi:hypothetical protein
VRATFYYAMGGKVCLNGLSLDPPIILEKIFYDISSNNITTKRHFIAGGRKRLVSFLTPSSRQFNFFIIYCIGIKYKPVKRLYHSGGSFTVLGPPVKVN